MSILVPLLLYVLVLVLGAALLKSVRPEKTTAWWVSVGLVIAGVIGIVSVLVPATMRLF